MEGDEVVVGTRPQLLVAERHEALVLPYLKRTEWVLHKCQRPVGRNSSGIEERRLEVGLRWP
jgi:hypothetical protein